MSTKGAEPVLILVVDDDSESCRMLSTILTAEGYQVRTADAGRLALEFVSICRPDLILLDIRMAGLDGFEVCRRLKDNPVSRDIPLMFLSASGESAERIEGLRLGAVDFVTKPFEREELLARVHTHVDLGRLRAHLERRVEARTAELRESERSLRELSGRLISAQEDERKRIARELHDDLNQRVADLGISLSSIVRRLSPKENLLRDELVSIQSRLLSLSDGLRNISHELHPSVLELFGLVTALQSHCREFTALTSIPVDFEAGPVQSLSSDASLCLYRVAQESLRNIARHSKATNVWLRISQRGNALHLHVSDNGVGFDVEEARARGGLGLRSMEERVRLSAGIIELTSRPGKGTDLVVTIDHPFDPEPPSLESQWPSARANDTAPVPK